MTDQSNGLRFDIYERVHLPDEVAAIEELEEIELVPHMQALPQEDEVLLRGHLLLSGVYKSQDSPSISQLEHWIPVEITLPLSRVHRVEDLAVEIDNFDVDLLSTRSLNVTGVLALRGLEVASAGAPVWREDSFTVVHQAPAEEPYYSEYAEPVQGAAERPPYEPAPVQQNNEWGTGGQQSFIPAWPGYGPEGQDAPAGRDIGASGGEAYPSATLSSAEQPTQPDNGWLSFFQNGNLSSGHPTAQNEEEGGREPEQEAAVQASDGFLGQDELSRIVYSDESSSARLWGDVSNRRSEELDSVAQEPTEAAVSEAPKDDKADLKVAVGGRPLDAPDKPTTSVAVLSLLGEKGAIREAEQKLLAAKLAEEEAALLKEAKESTGDEVEWTQLFLAKDSEHQSFRKVKLCIVQRQDTLEAIATRYNVQTRELQLHNRLTDPYISEGQVLYIP